MVSDCRSCHGENGWTRAPGNRTLDGSKDRTWLTRQPRRTIQTPLHSTVNWALRVTQPIKMSNVLLITTSSARFLRIPFCCKIDIFPHFFTQHPGSMPYRQDRFYSPSGAIYPSGPSIWHVIDWDQRRLVSVKMDEEQESPDCAFDCLLKHIDQLPPDVYLVHT